MTDSDKLIDINRGKQANVTLQWLSPLFAEQEKKLISDLKNLYRSGVFSESKLVAIAAGLCTLEDTVMRLKQKIRTGEAASEELNGR